MAYGIVVEGVVNCLQMHKARRLLLHLSAHTAAEAAVAVVVEVAVVVQKSDVPDYSGTVVRMRFGELQMELTDVAVASGQNRRFCSYRAW